jgi:hypothetical protein
MILEENVLYRARCNINLYYGGFHNEREDSFHET